VKKNLFFSMSQFILLFIGWVALDFTALVISEFIIVLFLLIDKWGKGIILREVIASHMVFVLLFMPLVGYNFYSIENSSSKLWVKYMPIGEFEYFSFVFPATLVFILVLCWPIYSNNKIDENVLFLERLKRSSNKLRISNVNPKILILLASGIYFLVPFLPTAFQYIGYLFFTLSFVGFLMLYIDVNAKYRNLFLGYFGIFIFYVSLYSTMFTIIVYMGMTLSSFLYLNFKLTFLKKIAGFVIVCISILILQTVKGTFRSFVASGTTTNENKALYFGQLLVEEASKGYSNYSSDRFFQFYVRANQGLLVAKVINYIPQKKEFDNGQYLGQAIFSSLIPRVFWPDKPMAGGKFTMKYFTGEELVGHTSMNVSPVGEAYGSFGPNLGIIYMGILALFIRLVYLWYISLTNTIPFLIFWFPVIFFQVTYSMETDSLQIFNSLFKSGTFVFILYIISPSLFGVERKSFLSLK